MCDCAEELARKKEKSDACLRALPGQPPPGCSADCPNRAQTGNFFTNSFLGRLLFGNSAPSTRSVSSSTFSSSDSSLRGRGNARSQGRVIMLARGTPSPFHANCVPDPMGGQSGRRRGWFGSLFGGGGGGRGGGGGPLRMLMMMLFLGAFLVGLSFLACKACTPGAGGGGGFSPREFISAVINRVLNIINSVLNQIRGINWCRIVDFLKSIGACRLLGIGGGGCGSPAPPKPC